MQGSNLRDAPAPTTVFETAAFPLGQSSNTTATAGAVAEVVVVEVPGVEPGPSPYQGAAQTAMLHLVKGAEGARIERAPGIRPDLGLAIRCLTSSASPPWVFDAVLGAPGRSRTCMPASGRAGLSRVRVPVPPQGLRCRYGCPSRVRTSVSAARTRCPCHLDQRATASVRVSAWAPGPGVEPGLTDPKSAVLPLHQPGPAWCPHQDSNLDWTRSGRAASTDWATRASAEIRRRQGGGRWEPLLGIEPSSSRLRDGCSAS